MNLTKIARLVMLVLAGLVLLTIGLFGLSRLVAGERVIGAVSALGIELDGMNQTEVREALAAAEAELEARPVTFEVNEQVAPLLPVQVGFDVDTESITTEVMSIGRTGEASNQFRWWLTHLGGRVIVPSTATVEDALIEEVLATWDEAYIGDPPFPGGVVLDGVTPTPSYPETGRQIDRGQAIPIVRGTLADVESSTSPIALPVVEVEAQVDDATVDEAVDRANLWLSSPITLISANGEAEVTFEIEDLAAAFRSEPVDGTIKLSFDSEVVGDKLTDIRSEVEEAPIDARFDIIDGTHVEVLPGRNGTEIDPETTATNLAIAAGGNVRRGVLPLTEGAAPDVTTEELDALGIEHLVSQFTTYHSCCQNRVENIHLIAETVDRTIIPAGATFSLNDTAGERTEDRGYLEDGTIVRGELTETFGGGVSQFATTMYNAIFWGGYEDVAHKPHSFYFPRYPRGIEATISWPQPDLQFRNNTDSGVLVDTSYTDTSVTVRLFGNNDGRILVGDWTEPGPYEFSLLAEGGDAARRVDGEVGEKENLRDPPDTLYRANPDLDVDSSQTIQTSTEGYSVTVTRTITVGDSENTETWTAIYSPRQEIIEVHPCMVPDGGVECPTPSTTTTAPPPDTTTTTTITSTTGTSTTGSTAQS